jgi:hypothetical protein
MPKKRSAPRDISRNKQTGKEEEQQEGDFIDDDDFESRKMFSPSDRADLKWARRNYSSTEFVVRDSQGVPLRSHQYFLPEWPRYKLKQLAEELRIDGGWKSVFIEASSQHMEFSNETPEERDARVANRVREDRAKAQKEFGAKLSRECRATCFYVTIGIFGVALLACAISYIKGSLTEQSATTIAGTAIFTEILVGLVLLFGWLGT